MSDLEALFSPRGVAVVGASRHGNKLGAVMARSLEAFPGGCSLVNSRHPDRAAGVHPTMLDALQEAESPIDLAVVCVPAAACAAVVEDAAAAGVRAVLICAGGFAEAGVAGSGLYTGLLQTARRLGVRVLGPNTSGFFIPERSLLASFVPGVAEIPPGNIAVVATSGGVNHALCFDLANSDNGVRLGVGIGAGGDVTAAEVLEHLLADPATAAVGLHVETIPDGPRLFDAVAALCATKPVVALVAGVAGPSEFARSHTGALATSWHTARAVLRQAGAVLVGDERQMREALEALSRTRLRPTSHTRAGMVTAQAGPGLLLADQLGKAAIALPVLCARTRTELESLLPPMTYQHNPVDTGRPGVSFPAVLHAVATDPSIDLLLSYTLLERGSIDPVGAIEDADLPRGVPAVVGIGGLGEEVEDCRTRLHKHGIPTAMTTAAVTTAARALAEDARNRALATSRTRPFRFSGRPSGTTVARAGLDEDEAKSFLGTLGIATPARAVCETLEEARAALDRLGVPVAVKILDATIQHKTEVAGVHLGVTDQPGVDRAFQALVRTGARRILVEAMAPSGTDLIVSARRDEVFGTVVMLGLGGIGAELAADFTLRRVPAADAQLASMIEDLRGSAALTSPRVGAAVEPAELVEVLGAIGCAVESDPTLAQIEINPLRATADGLVALDAVVTTGTEDT